MSKPFMAAINSYFGKQPGQSLQDFKKEIDALTMKDREEIAGMLAQHVGEEVTWQKVPSNDTTAGIAEKTA